jgi:hypothetical protein
MAYVVAILEGGKIFFFSSDFLCCSASIHRFADSWRFSVAALPSADALRPAPAVAALLNASGSEDSHRGPYQQS